MRMGNDCISIVESLSNHSVFPRFIRLPLAQTCLYGQALTG